MSQETTKEVLEEAGKRLLPAAAYLISPVAGFIASSFIFFTWLASRFRREERTCLEVSEERLVELKMSMEEVGRELELKKRVLEEASGVQREALLTEVGFLERELERLRDLYRIEFIRYMAWRVAERIGDKKLLKYLKDFEKRLERGEEPSREQLEILHRLEEYREKGVLREVVVQKILESMYNR